MHIKSNYFLKIALIVVSSIAITACSSNGTKKPEASETINVQQTVAPTPSLSPSLSPSPTLMPSANPNTSKVVMENEAFRIYEPAPNTEVGTTFTVKGQARVFEAAFSYSFEDGHKVLAEGNEHAAAGAPEWADFEYTVTFEKPTNPVGALIIFEKSAKDGSSTNQLMIPLKFNPDIIEPVQ